MIRHHVVQPIMSRFTELARPPNLQAAIDYMLSVWPDLTDEERQHILAWADRRGGEELAEAEDLLDEGLGLDRFEPEVRRGIMAGVYEGWDRFKRKLERRGRPPE